MKHHTASNASRPKAFLLLAIFTLLSATTVRGQEPITVTIGNESSQSGLPFIAYAYDNDEINRYVVCQEIYTSDEIGGTAGFITKISFYFNPKEEPFEEEEPSFFEDVQVFLKHTDKSWFSDTGMMIPVNAADMVYNGNYNCSSTGWKDIILETPFPYDGSSNLLVCCNRPPQFYISSSTCFNGHNKVLPIGDSRTLLTFDNEPLSLDFPNTGESLAFRNNIQLTIVPEPIPFNLAVGDITNESASLSWEEPETPYTLTGYVYQYKKTADDDWSAEAFTNTTNATLDGLAGGTEYQFRVKCLFSDHESIYTKINFTTEAITLPNLAVSNITDQSATITWEEPQTPYTLTGYAYQYKKAADTNWSAEATTTNTSVTLNGLEGFTEYHFRTKALFSGHEDTYSYISFTTDMSLPYECGFENGMDGWSMVDVDWGQTEIRPESPHGGQYSFRFINWLSGEHGPQYLISPRFTGTEALTVSFFYRAFDNNITFSIGYSTTTGNPDAFTWTDAITVPYPGWSLYENTFPEGTQYVALSFNHVYDGTTYRIYLDDFLFEAYSPYPKPSDLAVNELADISATLSWTAPETSSTVTGYVYQYRKATDANWSAEVTTTDTYATLNGLSIGAQYQFRVKTIYGDGESPYSFISFTTVAIPLSNLAVGDITNASATLSWEELETPYTVSGYVYQYKKTADADWSAEAFTTATSITLSGLTGGTEYQFRAKVLFSDHEGAWSTIGFTTLAITLPNLIASTVTETSATITWEEPQTPYALTGYAYQYKKANDADWSAETTTTNTSVTFNGLEVFTEYQFRAKPLFSNHEDTYSYLSFTTYMSLPYECGFENDMGGFYMVDCNVDWTAGIYYNNYTGRRAQAKHDGEVGFQFFAYAPWNQKPQYLISPRFAGNANILMSFYYKNISSGYHEIFQVGYSTTTDDLSTFTWSDEITASNAEWNRYESDFPPETKYFAIKYISEYKLYLDDFSFTVYSPYPKPSDIVVNNVTETSATLSWTAPQTTYTLTGYAYQYKTLTETTWSAETTINATSVTLNGLSINTSYDFRVKALYAGNNASNYVSTRFMTEGEMESLPHFQGFENGMGGWRIVDGKPGTGIYSDDPDFIYNGACSFAFHFVPINSIPQYLISPQFDGNSAMIISFYYKNDFEDTPSYTTDYQVDFQVGYSTTTKDLDAFTWGDTIRSSHQWQQHGEIFPAGTKYVAVQWIRGFRLFLDEFNLEISPSCDDPFTVDIDHPFTEGFEGFFFPPLCWVRNSYVMDGDTRCWKKETVLVHSGLASASNSYFGDLYLKTPELHLAENACEVQLSFWALFRNPGIYKKSSVVLIEGDNETEVWAANSSSIVGSGDWREIDIDLSAFRGHTFSLAFKHEGYPTHLWAIDDVEISVTATCEVPTDINLSFSNTDAMVTWAGEAEAWQLCLDDDDDYIDVNEPAYTFTNLESCSTHTVKVRAKCGEGCFSLWSDPINFYIAIPITTFPWMEDFESYNVNSIPDCWDNSASTSPTLSYNASSLWGTYSYNGNMMIRMYEHGVQPGTALINTPVIALPSEEEIELKFDYSHRAACDPFTVKISTDHGTTFVDLASYGRYGSFYSYAEPIEFFEAVIPLTEYAGQEVMLQFYANSAWSYGAIFIDNIEIRVPLTCRDTYGLRTENIAAYSAELSWNISADMESYTVRHRTPASPINPIFTEGFENGIADWTMRDCQAQTKVYATTSAHSGDAVFRFTGDSNYPPQYLISPMLTGVDEGKRLEFYFYNTSSFIPETFYIGFSSTDTEIASFTFGDEIVAWDMKWHIYSVPIPAGTKYICWKYTSRYRHELYIDDIVVGDDTPPGEWQIMTVTGSGTQASATLTGLTLNTNYEAQVKSNCEEAEWSKTISFSTASDFEVNDYVYTIYTATGWDFFCDALQDNDTYNHFSGKTVKLGDDISVTRMAGSTDHEFSGIFDGQGHTLTVDINDITTNSAPFREIRGATIRNLKVTGSVVGIRHSAGLVAIARGEDSSIVNTIENCLVSTDVTATNDQKCYLGGIVGHGLKSSLIIRGCVFNGSLTSTSYYVGGLQGWSDGNTLTLENDLFDGTVNAAPEGFHPVAIHTKYQETNATVNNVYYTVEPTVPDNSPYIAATGQLVIASAAVSPVGEATATYDVSDLAFYSNGVQFGDMFYYDPETAATQTIALASGANWVSFDVEITLNNLKTVLVDAVPGTSITVKGQNRSTRYLPAQNKWVGNLNTLDLTQMYIITVSADTEITLVVRVNSAALPITIKNGTNWMAFPLSESLTLTDAFTGFAVCRKPMGRETDDP